MGKLTAPVREAARILDLVPYLDTHPFVAISELAKTFSVSVKEMEQSLMHLSMCGTPGLTPYDLIEVNYETGFVTINQHEDLNMVRSFTHEEISTLMLGLLLLQEDISAANPELIAIIDSLIEKLSALVDSPVSRVKSEESETARLLKDAIASRHLVHATYNDAPRDLEPISLSQEGTHSYLFAFCMKSQEFKTFRVDKFSEVSISSKTFASRQFDKERSKERLVEVPVTINFGRRRFNELFNFSSINRKGEATLKAFSLEWATKAIVATAGGVSVRNDPSASREVAAYAQSILAIYQD